MGFHIFNFTTKSKFEFPVYNKRHKTDFQHSFCRLKIPKGFVGFINIHFVIDHIEGNGVLIKGLNHIVTSESKSLNNPGVYRVISDSLEIYSYINPLLIKFDSFNKFQISSNYHNKPIVKLTNSGLKESNLWGNGQNNQFFKNINQYLLYFSEQTNLQTTLNIINFEELENSIFKFYLMIT